MSDMDDVPPAVAAPPRRLRISLVWIVPIVAALVAGGIALQRILREGPTITILFKSAPGIEAGKTFVKYKDVGIGQVTGVRLSGEHRPAHRGPQQRHVHGLGQPGRHRR